jgi:hypothetical protein
MKKHVGAHRTPEQLRELECLYQVFKLARTDPRLSTWVFIVRGEGTGNWSELLARLRKFAASLEEKAA